MVSQTRIHVAIGAVVSYAFFPLPGAPLVGGALAGYLEGFDPREGAAVGLLTGALTMALMVSVLLVREFGSLDRGLVDYVWATLIHPVLGNVVPLLVFSLLGGAIGAYVRRESGL